jgi:uncharacterized protein
MGMDSSTVESVRPSISPFLESGRGRGHSRNRRSWPRRHRRALIVASIVLLLVLLAAGAGTSWYFSSQVVVPNHSSFPADSTIEGIAAGRVVLTRSQATLRPGVYGTEWYAGNTTSPGPMAGHAVIGAILTSNADTVTRRLSAVRGRLTPGTKVALDDVYIGDPAQALGLVFANVRIPDELGPMPAWLIPADTTTRTTSPSTTFPSLSTFPSPSTSVPSTSVTRARTWAIVVHGINGNREDDLYIAPTLHQAGLTSLLITYREDVGAPASPDGLLHMGFTEWRDLQAAAAYALAHGAQHLVLIGISMGGAIVAQFMERSPLARHVSGLILDSPALDWKSILSFNASEMGLPSFAAIPVEWAIDLRIDPDWDSLDALDHPDSFHLPILLFHGTDDRIVPISTSDAFARELPGWVTYYRVPYAGHFESWNVDPQLYDQRVAAFLSRIGA